MQPHSTTITRNSFPDLGTLWMHERYGLVMYLGEEPYRDTTLYTVYVLFVRSQRHTEGIFEPVDWYEQFTPV